MSAHRTASPSTRRVGSGLRCGVAARSTGSRRRVTLSEVIELPVTQVTACTFGGTGLDELFITTSREGLSASQEPAAGALFHVRPGIAGRPVRHFAG